MFFFQQYHGLPLSQWVQDNYDKIMKANDDRFYIDFVTVEMGKLISGRRLRSRVLTSFLFYFFQEEYWTLWWLTWSTKYIRAPVASCTFWEWWVGANAFWKVPDSWFTSSPFAAWLLRLRNAKAVEHVRNLQVATFRRRLHFRAEKRRRQSILRPHFVQERQPNRSDHYQPRHHIW